MKRTGIYIVIGASLILVGVVLVNLLPLEQRETPSILPDQATLFEELLPTIPLSEEADIPVEVLAEVAMPFNNNGFPVPVVTLPLDIPVPLDVPVELSGLFAEPAEVLPASEPVLIQPVVVLQPLVALEEEAVVEELPIFVSVEPVQATPSTAPVPPAYIYFFTGIPVQPAPMPIALHTGGFMPVTFVPVPVIQSQVVPVFTPRVVPSRVGAPRLVYPNGVVIRPTVYFPNQPFRNVLRAVTP